MKNLLTLAILLLSSFIFAQADKSINPENIAKVYLLQQLDDWRLNPEDVSDIILKDRLFTKHNRVTSLYFVQRYQGLEIYNTLYGAHISPDGKVLTANSRFIPNIKNRINTIHAKITAQKSLQIVYNHFNIQALTPTIKEKNNHFIRYKKDESSTIGITNQLIFFPKGKQLLLAWAITIQPQRDDLWQIIVDAKTGAIITQNSLTLHCGIEHILAPNKNCFVQSNTHHTQPVINQNGPDGSSYRVFPYHVESPLYGNQALLTDPALLAASPYGWHDTNGADGAEYTITRGNNVHAYLDLNAQDVSAGDEPDGGASLTFDFPFNPNAEPSANRDAAVTNLFYMNNFMHDFAFQYGFDEEAGNFQFKNYVGPNFKAGDPVMAHAQDGEELNNANFSAPPDGTSPTMQMMIFSNQGGQYLTLNQPMSIAGNYSTGKAIFGPAVTNIPVTGEVVIIEDGDPSNPFLGCNQTSQDLTGKIAFVERGGSCVYANKAIYAQNKGAIGLIVGNFLNNTPDMSSPAALGNQVNIPLVLIAKADADLLKSKINNGELVEASLVKNNTSGPNALDADFSNFTIAHEYTHGISIRLTGGGANIGCLFNDEQMGEGWSDFFALALSAKSSENGTESRGIGNYLLKKGVNGLGGRRHPYSTDLTINPVTYYDILNTNKPHDVGEVWASCLWDLYWLMVEKYGFDEDIYNGTGGNNKAIQLVMDGMKLQPCSPGFVDGRDALLAADLANNGGANECLIWAAFAKRGIGVGADQGSSDDRNDGIESYEKPQSCTKELAITKKMSPVINAGENIDVELTIFNYKGNDLSSVTVTDLIPENTSFVAGSSSTPASVSSDMITFNVGDMGDKATLTIHYQLSTSAAHPSTSLWSDDFEFNDSKWIKESVKGTNFWNWDQSSSLGYAHSGTHAYFVTGAVGESVQRLRLKDAVTITGAKPILRFFQRYDTKPGLDGGILEFSTDGGAHWFDASSYFFREGYARPMDFWTFNQVDQGGFSGKSKNDGYVETMVDLSSFVGESLDMRFHFASHFSNFDQSKLWSIDDVEFMDMNHYNSDACVTSAQGDHACAQAKEKGTVVYSNIFVGTEDSDLPIFDISIAPNPAKDFANITISSNIQNNIEIRILNLNGQQILTKSATLRPGNQSFRMPTSHLPNGVYFVQIRSSEGIKTVKFVKSSF